MNDYSKYKAKKTFYNGVEFKSNLEARVAERFDELGILWEYEPYCFRGKEYAGGQYTPDFYLRKLDCFVEVAGVWDERHCKNFEAFTLPSPTNKKLHTLRYIGIDGTGKIINPKNRSLFWVLAKCKACNEYFFIDIKDIFECPYCDCNINNKDFRFIFSRDIFDSVFDVEDIKTIVNTLTFGDFLTKEKHIENVFLDNDRRVDWSRTRYDCHAMHSKYDAEFERWLQFQHDLLKARNLDEAELLVSKSGHEIVSQNWENGQIVVRNKVGRKFVYYVCTGTIPNTGGRYNGLEDFIRLLNDEHSLNPKNNNA